MAKRVLFVCLGNICRSPTAHGVFLDRVQRAGLGGDVKVDSAGTAAWHVGRPPDTRSQAFARRRGYDLTALRARQVAQSDFFDFDYILAMDKANLDALLALKPAASSSHVGLFLDYAQSATKEVPDPYYGGDDGFERVLDLIEDAAEGLLAALRRDCK